MPSSAVHRMLVAQYLESVHPIYLSCLDKQGEFRLDYYPAFLKEIGPYWQALENSVGELKERNQ